jgi:hypothetical protein
VSDTCEVTEHVDVTLSGGGDSLANKMFHRLFCRVNFEDGSVKDECDGDAAIRCNSRLGRGLNTPARGENREFPKALPLYCYRGHPSSTLVLASGARIGCPDPDAMCAIQMHLKSLVIQSSQDPEFANATTSFIAASINVLAYETIYIHVNATIDASGPYYNSTFLAPVPSTPSPTPQPTSPFEWMVPGGTMSGFGGSSRNVLNDIDIILLLGS